MEFLASTVSFLVLLGVLVFVHELGHFLVAKRLGIRVLKFSLGFGPVLVGRQWGETEYVLSAIPLGGYVKLYGEDPDEDLAGEDVDRSFSDHPVSHRLATVVAGPAMNFGLAVVLFSLLSFSGIPVMGIVESIEQHEPILGEVDPQRPAGLAGLRDGDRVVSIDGEPVESWEELTVIISTSGGKSLDITVQRGAAQETYQVVPVPLEESAGGEGAARRHVIGVTARHRLNFEETEPWAAPWVGIKATVKTTWLTLEFVGRVLTGEIEARRAIGGPIAIAQMAGESAKAGFLEFLFLVALLSVNLGVLNLLPIPVLDGGHVFFFGVEAVRGRPVSVKHRELAQQVGLALLLLLMLFVFYNDISRIVSG